MKPMSTRPVLSMNFYQSPNQTNIDRNNDTKKQKIKTNYIQSSNVEFGVNPYRQMIEDAEHQQVMKQIVKKEEVISAMHHVSGILDEFFDQANAGSKLGQTAKFSERVVNQSGQVCMDQNGNEMKYKDAQIKYHCDLKYFKHLRKKLKKINQYIDAAIQQ